MHSSRRGSRDIEHIGSAHDETELEALKAAARQRLIAGQDELDLGLERTEPARRVRGGPLSGTGTDDPPVRREKSPGPIGGVDAARPARESAATPAGDRMVYRR